MIEMYIYTGTPLRCLCHTCHHILVGSSISRSTICQHHLCRIVKVGNRVVAAIKRIPRKEFHGALHGWPKLSRRYRSRQIIIYCGTRVEVCFRNERSRCQRSEQTEFIPFQIVCRRNFRTSGHDTSASAHIMHCHWHPFTRHFLFDARKENNRKEDYHHHRFDTIIS